MPEASLISMTLYTFTQQSEITLHNKPIVQMSAPSVIAMLSTMTVIRQINLLTGATNTPVTKEQLLDLNAQLNEIAI